MLLLGSSFGKIPIVSLRSGRVSGAVVGHLINPHKMRVDALWVKTPEQKEVCLLLKQDVREISIKGIIIDDVDVLSPREDLIRLEPVISLRFELVGKKVLSGRIPLGKVEDYALDRESLNVQKLYVAPSILGKFKTTRLTIDRSQILEVSHRYVRVKTGEVKENFRIPNVRQAELSTPSTASASLIEE